MKILIADDDENIRELLEETLRDEGWEADAVPDGESVLDRLEGVDVLITDLKMPGMDGLELLRRVRQQRPAIQVIIMTGHGTIPSAVEAVKEGARAYLTKPFDPDELKAQCREIQKVAALRDVAKATGRGNLVGSSRVMQQVYVEIDIAAASEAPVLITGDTGTGKNLVAQAIHMLSPIRDRPFVTVNLGALPRDLVEGELFGYEKGAFTGAAAKKKGRFQLAHGGTLLLDEIDSLPVDLQPKLLQAIEKKEIWPLGGEKPDRVHVRIMAATNAEVEELVKREMFREDLYYRLNVIRIHTPPLRKHMEDVPQIAYHLLSRLQPEGSEQKVSISPEAMAHLMTQHWSGNIRELANAIERAFVRATVVGRAGEVAHVEIGPECFDQLPPMELGLPFKEAKARAMDEWSKHVIRTALAKCENNVSKTARYLQMNRTALIRLMKRYELGGET